MAGGPPPSGPGDVALVEAERQRKGPLHLASRHSSP
jgi:hypothetical protein